MWHWAIAEYFQCPLEDILIFHSVWGHGAYLWHLWFLCAAYKCTYLLTYLLTMHFSAKRGLAIACRPSVCPSVTLVDCVHIGWKSWKLIAQTIGPKPSLLLANMQAIHLLTWGTWGNLGETRGGVGKNGMLEKGNISETHKDRGKNTRKGLYRNSPITLFWAVPSPTSYTHPFDP